MKKSLCLVATLVFLAILLFGPTSSCAASAKPIELKFSMWNSMQHTTAVEVFAPFAKELEQRTQGRVKITFYPGEALGKARDHYDMAVRGISRYFCFYSRLYCRADSLWQG